MSSGSLEVPHRPRGADGSRWGRRAAVAGAVLLVIGWVIWFVRTPDDLPLTDRTVEEVGTAGTPLYVGMFTMPDGDRTIDVSEVRIDIRSGDADVEALACSGGSVSVTTGPENSCQETGDPRGDLHGGDSIMLRVSADAATEVVLGRIEIAFREGIRWGTKEAGLEGATVSFADRTAP